MYKIKYFSALLVLCSLLPSAYAINLQRFSFSKSPTFATVEDSGSSLDLQDREYEYLLDLNYNYVDTPLIVTSDDDLEEEIIDRIQALNFGGIFKITDELELGFNTFIANQTLNSSNFIDVEEGNFTKLGEIHLISKYLFSKDEKWSTSFYADVTIPSGEDEYFVSNKDAGGRIGFILDRKYDNLQLTANFFHMQNDSALLENIDYRDLFRVSVAGLYKLTDKLGVYSEFFKDIPYDYSPKNDQSPSELGGGIRYHLNADRILFTGLNLADVTQENSSNYRFYAGLKCIYGNRKPKQLIKTMHHYERELGATIYFKTGSSIIEEDEKSKIRRMLTKVAKIQDEVQEIEVKGYASQKGTDDSNMILSKKRANKVIKFLRDEGLSPKLIISKEFGETASTSEDQDDFEDRRVDLTIIYKYVRSKTSEE